MFVLALAEGGSALQLIPDGTILIHIAMILLMIFVLNRTLFRPINRILESREKNTGGRSGEAQEILKEAGNKESAYNNSLREIRSEGYGIIESRRAEAISARNGQISASKEEIFDRIESEKSAIHKQYVEIQGDLTKEAQKMAEKISANILKSA